MQKQGRWKLYTLPYGYDIPPTPAPTYAWLAPDIPDGAILVGQTDTYEEGIALLTLACSKSQDGLYLPYLHSAPDDPDEFIKVFIERVSSIQRQTTKEKQL